jgi:nifR3 family TIM-barrel protein
METLQLPTTLRIGNLALETPILLAPMAGFTDLPFRMSVRPLGGLGLAYAEMVNPPSVLFGGGKRRREILATVPEDRPLGYQIYGTDPQLMAEAARWLVDSGAAVIDINMGCPRREITSSGAGSALLKTPDLAVRVAERVVAAVGVPVTVKMRLGWEEGTLVAPELARELERVGVAAVTVHGRTRAQGFGGAADLGGIRRVVEAVERIPVIGNGDVTSPQAALRMLRETGCAGIMVARGAVRDPWLIRDIWQALQGLPPIPEPDRAERLAMLRDQFERSILHYGEKHAVAIFRRWVPEVSKKLQLGRETMLKLLRAPDIPEMRRELAALSSS